MDDQEAKTALQESIWAAVDYEQTAESADGLEEQIRLLSQAIETAKATVKAYTVHLISTEEPESFPEIKTTFEGSG